MQAQIRTFQISSLHRVKRYWEIIADNLSKAGWSLGWVSAIDSEGRTIWIVDAHRDDGNRFVVHAEERLTAFLELESLVRNEKRKEGKPKQSLLSLRKVRSGSGQARTARRDIHETDHKPNPRIPRIRGERIQTRR
jgi:hypothetical protein